MINRLSQVFFAMLVVFCASLLIEAEALSQELSREVREKFVSMMDDLGPALKSKFQKALDNNTAIVEMTPAEFRRFRNNPANPFDINDVDPDDLDGNIELKFELPSLRNRPVKRFERQSRSLRRNLRSVVSKVANSTVKIVDDNGQQIALGAIVRDDGLILTKASEVTEIENVSVVVGAKTNYAARVVHHDKSNDLALLKIDVNGLSPVSWSDAQPIGGTFVVTPNQLGEVVSIGSYSAVNRSTIGENRGFLGVAPAAVANGVEIIERIETDTAAFAAGLRIGDIIQSIDGLAITRVDQLVYEISRRSAGDEIEIVFTRNGRRKSTQAKLSGLNINSERAARFKMMSRLGAILSDRKSEFPVVFQHDSPLFPEQCGGPICDLQGNVLGINIARESRAASYAIPTKHIKSSLDQWLRFDVAARDLDAR